MFCTIVEPIEEIESVETKNDLIEKLNDLANSSLRKGCLRRYDYKVLIESWPDMSIEELKIQLEAFHTFKILRE